MSRVLRYDIESYDTGISIDRNPPYLPGIPLTGPQLVDWWAECVDENRRIALRMGDWLKEMIG